MRSVKGNRSATDRQTNVNIDALFIGLFQNFLPAAHRHNLGNLRGLRSREGGGGMGEKLEKTKKKKKSCWVKKKKKQKKNVKKKK